MPPEELLKSCRITKGRSSGPGGQHRNKTETEIVILHEPSGISSKAGERRSAEVNRKVALRRLRLALATEVRHGVPAGDARSELWKSRCRRGAISCNPRHEDFPALLAEAMEMIEACRLDHRKAAIRLECTPSQLIKLVKAHPPALGHLNAKRGERGLAALR